MRIHEILAGLLTGSPGSLTLGDQPTVNDIITALGSRSFGLVLVMFGLPNLLPVPGLPILCGFIIALIAVQMLRGRDHLVLPRWVGGRRVKRDDLARIVAKATPTLSAIEHAMRPRIAVLSGPSMQRVLGAVLCILALALMAPIPFFGGIAPGIAVILLGLGLAERDGLVILLGGAASVAAVLLTAFVTLAILKSLAWLVL